MRYWTEKENKSLLKAKTDKELAKLFPGDNLSSLKRRKRELAKLVKVTGKLPRVRKVIQVKDIQDLESERLARSERKDQQVFKRTHEELIKKLEYMEEEREALIQLKRTPQLIHIEPRTDKKSEAVPIVVYSDWHIEERVDEGSVSGLNRYNIQIAEERVKTLFQNTLRLLNILGKENNIKEVVIALLGDFISGAIHDELVELAELLPGDAMWKVQNMIVSGINFLLKETDYNFLLVCHSGNHGRMTKKTHFATEQGNSLEVYMYRNLADIYKNEKRIKFQIAEGYHSYVNVLGFLVRFHHGHELKYGGGVGGLYIPTNKAIGQWNKGNNAYLDIFGHYHQLKDGGNFICNGSVIGYNAYALSIKADYEKPKQALVMIHKKRGKGLVAPIWVD